MYKNNGTADAHFCRVTNENSVKHPLSLKTLMHALLSLVTDGS